MSEIEIERKMNNNNVPNMMGFWAISTQDYLQLIREINNLRAEVVELTIENGQLRDDHQLMHGHLQAAHRREQQWKGVMTAMKKDIDKLRTSNHELVKELKELFYSLLLKMKVDCGDGNSSDPLDDAVYDLQLKREEYIILQEAYISLCIEL